MKRRNLQLKLLRDQPKSYGGELLKTRKARAHGRPLDTKNSLHLVLRSSKARDDRSFWKNKNKAEIFKIMRKFSQKYGVKIYSMANVGNHLHLHIKLSNLHTYKRFIRATTSAIAMAITGCSRWEPLKKREDKRDPTRKVKDSFWDYRPFTRVVVSLRAFLNLKDYIEINQLEGFGLQRSQARFYLKWNQLSALKESG